ncbi:putative F-box/FBD/LRR-repeat protein At4g03220 isoform X1 [Triticum aestivum]|uniref:putative F-box/FBD/LRR-repeat protein At4g03220 isoform X1 n=1 Tax=Triticum aestivum TaxID=4565 RepID=UPI001D0076C9|nr:putative F-box/FBD/LRR-repeat protein At4g03220 isoform X1 [Triticum aestivum]
MGAGHSVGRRDSDAGAGGEDRLSALPDDVLVSILVKLRDAAAAARASVLARRWRCLWPLLPELAFADGIQHHRIVPALAAHEALDLRDIQVATREASVEYLAVWLPIAARRLSGSMHLRVVWHEGEAEVRAALEPEQRGAILLPCFRRATSVVLEFSFLRLVLPPSGVFARLQILMLVGILVYGQCSLGDAVSSPRCPCLKVLFVQSARGLGSFRIHSRSLLQLQLSDLRDMQQLTVVAPLLQFLRVRWCFTNVAYALNPSQPVARISAPLLEKLEWMCDFVPSSVQLGEMPPHLRRLVAGIIMVYGSDCIAPHNRCCIGILQRFERLAALRLCLAYPPVIGNHKYLTEDMTRLPDVDYLTLDIFSCGHSFGPSSFHLLRMCSRLTILKIRFSCQLPAQTGCFSGCICDQPPNWKTEELGLIWLEEVQILSFAGTEHEVAFLKRLFSWATSLKRMMVTFHDSITESKGRELQQLLLSFSRPEICICILPCSAPS